LNGWRWCNGRRWRRNRNSRDRDRQRHGRPSHNLRLRFGPLIQHDATHRRVLALANVANDKADARERLGSASLISPPNIRYQNFDRRREPEIDARVGIHAPARLRRLLEHHAFRFG
jgi:hypothetical protein